MVTSLREPPNPPRTLVDDFDYRLLQYFGDFVTDNIFRPATLPMALLQHAGGHFKQHGWRQLKFNHKFNVLFETTASPGLQSFKARTSERGLRRHFGGRAGEHFFVSSTPQSTRGLYSAAFPPTLVAGSSGRFLAVARHLTISYMVTPSPLGQTPCLIGRTKRVVEGTKTRLHASGRVAKKAPVQTNPSQTPAPSLAKTK